MAHDSPETQPDDDLMAPDSSPNTAKLAGVRRVNKVPLMIGGAVALAFVAMLSIVVADKQAQQSKPSGEKKETVKAAANLADDVIGDNKGRSGTIEPAKPPVLPTDGPFAAPAAGASAPGAAPGTPPVMVARADAPPMPPGGVRAPGAPGAPSGAPPAENPDDQRIRMSKLALFDQALKSKTGVNATAPRSSGSSGGAYGASVAGQPPVMTSGDVAQRLAAVRAQISAAQESNPTAAYQQRLEQIKSLQANGAAPGSSGGGAVGQQSQAGNNASTTAPMGVGGSLMQTAAAGGGRNGIGQFTNGAGGDRWRLDSQPEAPRSAYELRAGYVIPATLISGINSELPGQIIGQVAASVYDTPTGKHVLIPQGSRLVGAYSSDVVYGQSRVLVAWQRVIFPDGKALDLGSMPGADSAGYAGFNDQVNNHYARIFGSALLMSGVVAGVTYTQQQNQQQGVFTTPSAQQTMSTALGQQLGQVAAQMISKNLSIAPTLEIRPGYRFNVVVIKDLTFSKPYASFDY
jgi:type IV secretion system protein TrbI